MRLDSFEQEAIFKSMTICDNSRWDYLDSSYGMDNDIECLNTILVSLYRTITIAWIKPNMRLGN